MMVTFVSQCEKKALNCTRRILILDASADRIGDNTWQTVITQEGLLADIFSVTERAGEETAKAQIWLRQTHADIMENFEPTVVKLKKKMKVVVAPGGVGWVNVE